MLRALRALALGYDYRALRALAASRSTLNNPLREHSVDKIHFPWRFAICEMHFFFKIHKNCNYPFETSQIIIHY